MDLKGNKMPNRKGHDISGKRPGKFKNINQYMDARFFRESKDYRTPLQKKLAELKNKEDKQCNT